MEVRPSPEAGKDSLYAAGLSADAATFTREAPGMSSFALEAVVVYHTYSAYARGLDSLSGMYQWLDRAPRGRNESLTPTAASLPAHSQRILYHRKGNYADIPFRYPRSKSTDRYAQFRARLAFFAGRDDALKKRILTHARAAPPGDTPFRVESLATAPVWTPGSGEDNPKALRGTLPILAAGPSKPDSGEILWKNLYAHSDRMKCRQTWPVPGRPNP